MFSESLPNWLTAVLIFLWVTPALTVLHSSSIFAALSVWFQADEDVDRFLREEHSFDDYAREVRKYTKLEKDILYNSRKVRSCFCGLITVAVFVAPCCVVTLMKMWSCIDIIECILKNPNIK